MEDVVWAYAEIYVTQGYWWAELVEARNRVDKDLVRYGMKTIGNVEVVGRAQETGVQVTVRWRVGQN